ncbi:MAG: hypothetical protein JWQ42_3156 [Edaphobacter sp.]|nr:hypothetical protein [Edaphobacter sp.]
MTDGQQEHARNNCNHKAMATTSKVWVRTPLLSLIPANLLIIWSSGFDRGGNSWHKFIVCTVDREQMFWIGRIGFQLLPQLQYLIINRPRGGIGVVTPHLIQQELPRKHPVDVVGKILQQPELVCS